MGIDIDATRLPGMNLRPVADACQYEIVIPPTTMAAATVGRTSV